MSEGPETVAIPDSLPDDQTSGLMCWLDGDRQCGADCMAYLTDPGTTPLGRQQASCLLLVSTERLARHATVIAKLLNDERVARQDQKRIEQKPPPTPR